MYMTHLTTCKLIFLSMALAAGACSDSMAQSKVVKNFPGLFAGIEWNTISGSWGVEYERFVYTKNKLAVGGKGNYVARYRHGNMQLLNSPCCETVSQVLVMGTASYYTSQRKNFTGLFLHASLGAGVAMYEYTQTYSNERSILRPAFELGSGWQVRVGNGSAFRAKVSASFGPFKGAFTSTTVAFGF